MDRGKKEVRMFGYGLSGALTVLGARLWWKHGLGPGSMKFFLAAAVLIGITAVRPQWLEPAHKVVSRCLGIIGNALSWVALACIFYLVFTPMGWCLRLFGKTLLDTRMREVESSTWQAHKPAERAAGYENQF